jgi:hypothetical protein
MEPDRAKDASDACRLHDGWSMATGAGPTITNE